MRTILIASSSSWLPPRRLQATQLPPLGEHLFSALSKCLITPPSLPLFFSLTLDKAGMAGTAERSAGEEELQSSSDALGLRAYIRLAQRVHPLLQPFTKLRRELKALRRSAQETERSTEQEQEHSDQESNCQLFSRRGPAHTHTAALADRLRADWLGDTHLGTFFCCLTHAAHTRAPNGHRAAPSGSHGGPLGAMGPLWAPDQRTDLTPTET